MAGVDPRETPSGHLRLSQQGAQQRQRGEQLQQGGQGQDRQQGGQRQQQPLKGRPPRQREARGPSQKPPKRQACLTFSAPVPEAATTVSNLREERRPQPLQDARLLPEGQDRPQPGGRGRPQLGGQSPPPEGPRHHQPPPFLQPATISLAKAAICSTVASTWINATAKCDSPERTGDCRPTSATSTTFTKSSSRGDRGPSSSSPTWCPLLWMERLA